MKSEVYEFEGKNVDKAIQNACEHFAVERDDLEIDILQGSSNGIFGLIGTKKAKITARLRSKIVNNKENERQKEQKSKSAFQSKSTQNNKPTEQSKVGEVRNSNIANQQKQELKKKQLKKESQPAKQQNDKLKFVEEGENRDLLENTRKPRVPLTEPQKTEAIAFIKNYFEHLLPQLCGEYEPEIDFQEEGIFISLINIEETVYLIGKDGKNLQATQYLLNVLITKCLPFCPKVLLDVNGYRKSQNEKLDQLAVFLADKAKKTGRVQVSKPLSAYHRRIIHMALKDDSLIITRSRGTGLMRQVMIIPQSKKNNQPNGEQQKI